MWLICDMEGDENDCFKRTGQSSLKIPPEYESFSVASLVLEFGIVTKYLSFK